MTDRRILAVLLLAGCPEGAPRVGLDLSHAPIRSCEVVLAHESPGAGTVEVGGRFNDWAPQPMRDDDGDGVWERSLGALLPGTYGYRLVVDGVWESLPPDGISTWDDGVENRALVVDDCEQPGLGALSGSATPDGRLEAVFELTRAADGMPLAEATATVGGRRAEVAVDPTTGRVTVTARGLDPGKHSVRVKATDLAGRAPRDGFLPLWVEEEPFVWQSGVLYQVFLDRFADGGGTFDTIAGTEYDGANYLGGDLVGARERLEAGWFDDLGVRSIWLSPIYQNPDQAYVGTGGWHYTGYHGYWPTEPRGVEDRLGTDDETAEQALAAFVEAAHERGIRVVLDLVLNHVHDDHPYVQALDLGAEPCVCTTEAGPCNWDSNPLFCWFTDYLPDIDYRDQRAVDQMVDDVEFWVEAYDVDGFRVDAAKHMDHVILRTLRARIEDRYEAAGGAPFYLVGETFVGQGGQGLIMQYVADWELHGQFDFPLLYPLRNGVGLESGFSDLAAEVRGSDAAYGEFVHWMSPFLGNHDIERYSTYIEGCPGWELFGGCHDPLAAPGIDATQARLIDKLAMSWAFVATQPGVPLLYYGDEVGLAGAGDPDNRRLMPWERSQAQDALLARFQAVGQLRAELPALQSGERRELWVDGDLYVYGRAILGGDAAIVALYQGDAPRTQIIPIPTGYDFEGVTLSDALGSGVTAPVAAGHLSLTLDPWQYVVLTP